MIDLFLKKSASCRDRIDLMRMLNAQLACVAVFACGDDDRNVWVMGSYVLYGVSGTRVKGMVIGDKSTILKGIYRLTHEAL